MSLTQNVNTLSDIEELDWTQLLDAYDYARPQRGELREGVVMQIEENGILVSIGTKREGVIPQQDLRQMGDEFLSSLKVGDRVITTGGIYGQVTRLGETSVQLQIADKIRIEVARAAIGGYQGQAPVVETTNS